MGWSDIEYTQIGTWPNWEWIYTFGGEEIDIIDWINLTDSVINVNSDEIISLHQTIRSQTDEETNRLIPGTEEFTSVLNDITSKISYLDGGTGFYDRSALNHIHSEYQFNPNFTNIKIGVNFRQYNPDTRGSIFMDTSYLITNNEFGIYSGVDLNFLNENLKINTTLRLDKNENFEFNFSPTSIVYKTSDVDILRFSLSSAVRNPTLSEQYLYYNG